MRQKFIRHSRSVISVILTVCMLVSCMAVGLVSTDAAQVDSDSVGASYYILMSASDNIPSWGAAQWIDVPVTQSGSKFTATIPRDKFSSVDGLTTGKNYFLCISNSKSGSGAFFDSESVTSSVSGTKFSANAIQEKDTKRAVRFSMASVDGVEAVVVTVTANSSTRNYALSTTGSTEIKYGVTVTANTGGSVVAGSTAIAAGKSTTVQVSNTNAMTFTATPASGYSFGGWTMNGLTLDSGYSLSDTTIKAKATGTGTLTAKFTKNAVQTRVVYYDNSQTNWTTPYARAYDDSGNEYLGAAPGTAMTEFDTANKVWYINVPVDAKYIVFSGDSGSPCSPQEIPTGYTGPEFYGYTGSGSGGSWQKYTSPLLDNEKNATLATETANNKDLYTNINATFFDYFTDSEVNGSWYSSIDSLKDGWVPTTAGRTNTAYWNQIRRDPYTIFNQQLSAYANNNTVTNPFYFGAFNEDGYRNPGYYRSGMLENGDLINDSNTLGENRTTGNNSKALPGLAADTLTAGNIYYKSGEKMELFDKEWLLTRTTGTRTPFANRIYFDPGQFNQHDSKYDSWSDNGAKFRILQYSGTDWWDNKYLNYDTNIGIYYFDLHDSCQKFKICRQNPSNNGTFDSSNGTVNNGWNSIEINTTAANAKGKLYRITGWNNYSTIDFNGAYSNYGYDKALAEIVNSKFPVRKTTQDNHDYYEFNSTDATDNIYFTNLTDNVLELNYGAGKGYGVKNGYNEGYGFFPFDKNDSGNTSSSVYGKDLAFGMKLEINFTLGANGQIMGTDNNLHDQKFNFSGDDDLWVFIDDQLVLDLGGDHAKTTGSINFHDRSLTYSPDPNTTLGSKKTTFTINNDDTSKVHKMTLFYLERGMQESNLKFGFSFIPVANQFVATESLSTEGINEGLKSVVETAAANDKITVKHETAKAENGSYSAAQNKTYKLEGDDNNHSTGNTGTYNLGNGDKATFVAQFDDGEGDDETLSPQPDYFKLTTTSASGNVFKYNTVLTSVTDLVMEQHVTQLGTDNNIFKFRSLKNPKNALDATDIQADFVSTINTKNLIISKSILGYSDPTKDFTVHVQLDIDGDGATFTDTNYALKYIKDGVENTMTADGTFTLMQDEVAIIQGIPEGAKVKISEENIASLSNPHYQHLSTEVLNNNAETLASATNGAAAVFVLDDDAMAEITNKPRLQDITVTKQTDVDDYDSEFKIKIETSSDNSEWTAKTGTLYGNGHNNAPIECTDTGGFYTVHKGDTLFIRNIPEDNYVRVTESKPTSASYDFTKSAVTVDGRTVTTGELTDTTFKQGSDANNVFGWYQVKAANNNVIVDNKLQRFKLEVTKLTNSNVTDTFKVKVLTSNALNGTYTENAFTQAGQFTISGLTDVAAFAKYSSETKEISLTKGQTLTVNNLAINTYVKVVESSTGTYHEWQSYSADTDVIKNTPASAADGAIVQMTADRALTINNKIKTKNVEIKKITDFRSDDVVFNFTVSVKREGEAANDNITTYKYTPNGAINGTEGTTAFGTDGKFALRKDGTIVIYNVPVKATVTVTEATPGNGYSFNKTQSTGAEFTDEGVATLTVSNGSNPTVTFANTKDKTVTIKKTTDWNNTADEFTFNVKKGTANYSGTAGTSYKVFNGSNQEQTRTFNENGNITLKKDEYVVIYGVKTGDKFTVRETENARYTLASVTGVVSSDNTEFTIADDNVSLTYLNEIKKNDVTIQKIINNSDDNETEFPLSIKVTKVENDPANQTFELKNGNQKVADISEGTALTTAKIKRSETLTIKDVPIGYTVEVIETDAQTGSFEFDSIEVVNNTAETSTIDANARKAVLTTKNTVAQVKITNKPIIRDIEITKSVDNGTGTFYVVVQLGNGYATSYQKKSTGNYGTTQTVGGDHKIAIQPGETIKISGVAKNTQVTVQEVDIDSDFVYVQSTVSGATGTELSGDNHGTEFTMGSENVTVNIQNKEDIKYQFEIKYIYEAYSATTYKDKTNKEPDNRVFGVDRSYTQSGRISKDDLNTYFNKESDGSLSIKNEKRKDFINKFAPYEDDFMLNLVWDDSNPKATYDADKKTIKLETTATSAPDRTVNVYFKLPYDVDNQTLAPSSNAPEKKDAVQHAKTTQYGNWVTTNNEYKDEKAADFVTAPLTLANGEHFQYWQITSATTTKRDTAVDSKRCYYDQFNMTMYQDCYVEPIYAATPTDFDPSSRSYADTQNGEARISFIENSRNQWNEKGGGTGMTGDRLQAGDRIYSDFLLTFGYKDRLLNSADKGGVDEAGFVLEQVRELDTSDGKYVTKKAGDYATENTTPLDTLKQNVKNYIAGQTVGGFVNKSIINLSGLDNKNQTKYSFSIKNKAYGNLEEGNAKKYVYRAYSYLKVGNDIVVSDPVYFTIYDMASIELGQTNAQGGQS